MLGIWRRVIRFMKAIWLIVQNFKHNYDGGSGWLETTTYDVLAIPKAFSSYESANKWIIENPDIIPDNIEVKQIEIIY